MEIKGEYQIASSRESVWAALNDPEVLKRCIPGCESLEKTSDTEFSGSVTATIGPVKARFKTKLSLEDLNPPESYTLAGESKAGVAGFGRGSAKVRLVEQAGGTLLSYEAEFKIGGKLAQVGSRLVLGVTRKIADQFFSAFSKDLDPGAQRIDVPVEGGAPSRATWLLVGGIVLLLLAAWFLVR